MRNHPMPSPAAAGPGIFAPGLGPMSNEPQDERQQARRLVARLRDHIAKIEGRMEKQQPPIYSRSERRTGPRWCFGLEAIDRNLPETGLARAGLHDIAPHKYGDNPAAMAFALALAHGRLQVIGEKRPLLWCRIETEVREHGNLYGHGLETLGLSRQRFLTVTLKKPVSLYWTMEEALKSGCLAAVIGDAAPQHETLTTTRRLSLAAAQGKSAGLLVFIRNYEGSTSSASRWQVATAPSQAPPLDGKSPGSPSWHLVLNRIRSGKPGQWTVNWQKHHATHHFTLAPGLSGGALYPGTPEIARPHPTPEPALRAG